MVTNDGATILKSLHIENPAAKVLVGILNVVFFNDENGCFILFVGFPMLLTDFGDVC